MDPEGSPSVTNVVVVAAVSLLFLFFFLLSDLLKSLRLCNYATDRNLTSHRRINFDHIPHIDLLSRILKLLPN